MSKQYLLMIEGPCYSFPIGLYGSPREALKAAAEFGLRNGDEPDCWPDDLFNRQDIIGSLGIETMNRDENYLPEGYSVYEFDRGVPRWRKAIEPYHERAVVTEEADEPKENWRIDPDQPFMF